MYPSRRIGAGYRQSQPPAAAGNRRLPTSTPVPVLPATARNASVSAAAAPPLRPAFPTAITKPAPAHPARPTPTAASSSLPRAQILLLRSPFPAPPPPSAARAASSAVPPPPLSAPRSHQGRRSYLLSFPRSGNHLVRAFVEHASGVPTAGCPGNVAKDPAIYGRTPLATEILGPRMLDGGKKEPVVMKSHGTMSGCGAGDRTRALVLLVRHPVEAVLSEARTGRLNAQHVHQYSEILRIYDGWTQQPRHVVYYEDVVTRTDQADSALTALGAFLQISAGRVAETVVAQDDVRRAALGTLNERNAKSNEDEQFYRRRATLHADDWTLLRTALAPWRHTLLARYEDLWTTATPV